MLSHKFKTAYINSLSNHFPSFYDDVSEYGNPQSANCIYFIPGINGVPGQIRFALPAASRFFGTDVYIKGLYLPEFSCRLPVWEKYTIQNLYKKIKQITNDLTALTERYGKVRVFCSSNGFYDFYAAANNMNSKTLNSITLFWVAAAPDKFENNVWERLFFKLNGFTHNNHRWTAFPNHNYLRWFNPETKHEHLCTAQKPHKHFYKHDIESRFYLHGSLWAYMSADCFSECLSHLLHNAKGKLSVPTYILAAENDGYWQNKTREEMRQVMEKYIEKPTILFRPTSHLWIAAPEYIYELLETSSVATPIEHF